MDCSKDESCLDRRVALRLKIAGIAAILISSCLGVMIPLVFRKFNQSRLFLVGQCFAAGVILSTGFVHILPDAFDALSNPCLAEHPWTKFPFAGFIAMTTSILVLLVDSTVLGYYMQRGESQGHTHHASHTHHSLEESQDPRVHNQASPIYNQESPISKAHDQEAQNQADLNSPSKVVTIKNKVVAQVLEFGILAHSLIIGIAMGTSNSPCTVRPLLGALVFHQFFEGLALGGCVSLGDFKVLSKLCMALFFAVTTPLGIGIGIIITSNYSENDPKALVVEGVFDSTSAGILIYMALVDLIASQFMSAEFLQKSLKYYAMGFISLMLGAGAMSVLAIWA